MMLNSTFLATQVKNTVERISPSQCFASLQTDVVLFRFFTETASAEMETLLQKIKDERFVGSHRMRVLLKDGEQKSVELQLSGSQGIGVCVMLDKTDDEHLHQELDKLKVAHQAAEFNSKE